MNTAPFISTEHVGQQIAGWQQAYEEQDGPLQLASIASEMLDSPEGGALVEHLIEELATCKSVDDLKHELAWSLARAYSAGGYRAPLRIIRGGKARVIPIKAC